VPQASRPFVGRKQAATVEETKALAQFCAVCRSWVVARITRLRSKRWKRFNRSLCQLGFHFLHRGVEVPQSFLNRQRVHIAAESLPRFQCGILIMPGDFDRE
jgi:hypothetical protein